MSAKRNVFREAIRKPYRFLKNGLLGASGTYGIGILVLLLVAAELHAYPGLHKYIRGIEDHWRWDACLYAIGIFGFGLGVVADRKAPRLAPKLKMAGTISAPFLILLVVALSILSNIRIRVPAPAPNSKGQPGIQRRAM